MALTLSNAHFEPKDSTGYYVYALRRDEDDMLWFRSLRAHGKNLYVCGKVRHRIS